MWWWDGSWMIWQFVLVVAFGGRGLGVALPVRV